MPKPKDNATNTGRLDIRRVPIESVLPWDKNPRGIKTKDFERLKKQILKLGVYKPLIAYRDGDTFIVLGGNMRIRALKEMGLKEVEISVVNPTSEAQKIEFALSDNNRLGFYEEDRLAELIYPHIQELDLSTFTVDLGEAIDLKQVVERFGPDIEEKQGDNGLPALIAKMTIPPRVWLTQRQEVIDAVNNLIEQYGASCEWPD